jgi:hypothetical protein
VQTKISIDPAAIAKFERTLSDFEAETGKTADEGMRVIARASLRRLATTVQPYGLAGGASMGKFVKSIEIQVFRAWLGTNLGAFPAESDMKRAHYAARQNGSVPKRLFRKEKGKPWLDLIPESARDSYSKVAMKKAFRAKAAWVKLYNDLGKGRMRNVSPLVYRHLNGARGEHAISGSGTKIKIQISNKVPYIDSIQKLQDVLKAQKEGERRGLKWMETATNKAIEKANKTLK